MSNPPFTHVGITLSIKPSEPFQTLTECAYQLADIHGEEVAIEWLNRVVAMSGELFMRCSIESMESLGRLQ